MGRDKSGHRRNSTKRGTLTFWRRHREGQVRTWKESDQARGTHRLESASGQVRLRKESDRVRGTHQLKMASGGTSEDTQRIRPSEGHSRPGDGIRRDKSGHGKNPIKRGALTNWRRHRGGQVRTPKKNHNMRHKEEEANPILVVTFQQQVTRVTIESAGFQLTQSDGKDNRHVSFMVLEWDNIHLVLTLLSIRAYHPVTPFITERHFRCSKSR